MARQRNPLRDEAYQIWIKSNKRKPLKDIAKELGVSDSTVRKWKSEDKWGHETNRSAPIEKERYGSMKGNKNAKDNPGNPNASPPPKNQNAVTHGLFSKIIPAETKELMSELHDSDPSDIIWTNIMFQYSAIIRAQKIMYVRDELDTTEWEKKRKGKWIPDDNGDPIFIPDEIEKEIQFAWDKQASFMNAQSRAMSTLSNLIKQFVAITDEGDERRLKLELMRAQISKVEIEKDMSKIKVGMLSSSGDETTEDKLDELLSKISGELDD